MQHPEQPQGPKTTFVDTLNNIRNGDVLGELTAELHTLVQAVRSTGLKGSIALQISIATATKGETHALIIQDEIKVKLPKSSHGSTFLFAGDDNSLSKRDPRQPELTGLRSVPAPVTQMQPREVARS